MGVYRRQRQETVPALHLDHGAGRSLLGETRKFLTRLVGELTDTAEANFRLDLPDDKQITSRQRHEDAERRGQIGSEWRPKPVPLPLVYVWRWFLELHAGRHRTDKGPQPITYADMVAWSTLTERKLGPFEIGVIRQLDQTYFFVLRNPTGGALFLNNEDHTENIKSIFRTLSKRQKKSSGASLGDIPAAVKTNSKPKKLVASK